MSIETNSEQSKELPDGYSLEWDGDCDWILMGPPDVIRLFGDRS